MSLIARLIECGAPADVIEDVALLIAEKRALDQRRENERNRKKRQRASDEVEIMSRDSTGRHGTDWDSADTPDQKNPPQTPHKKLSPPISPKGDITPHANGGLTTDEVLQAWNDTANALGLPAVAKLTDQRRRKLAGRIRDHPFEDWEAALKAIRRSKWLQGENDRGWRANFDWLLQPNTIPKLIEGQFDDQKTTH